MQFPTGYYCYSSKVWVSLFDIYLPGKRSLSNGLMCCLFRRVPRIRTIGCPGSAIHAANRARYVPAKDPCNRIIFFVTTFLRAKSGRFVNSHLITRKWTWNWTSSIWERETHWTWKSLSEVTRKTSFILNREITGQPLTSHKTTCKRT